MTAPTAAPAKKKKKLVALLGIVLVVAAGAYYFLVMNKASAAPSTPKPGTVVAMDPMTLNLADGHYLKLGLAIELTDSADAKSFDTSKAADLAIAEYSDGAMTDMSSARARQTLKTDYLTKLRQAYPHEIYEIYYKVFVMQ